MRPTLSDTWTRLAAESGGTTCARVGVGDNLLDTLRPGGLQDTPRVSEALEGVVHVTRVATMGELTSSLAHQLQTGETFVRGDRVQLQQVVLNLLMHAMEALTADIADRSVAVRCSVTDQNVDVSVRDTGVGLQQGAEILAFEPFFSTKPGGMGMGLSIARSIVEAHGGSIRVCDRRPGTVVRFTLPLDRT